MTPVLLLLLSACSSLWTDDDELNLRDLDGDGVPYAEDCDDHDRRVGADRYFRDVDGDGYGDPDVGLGCEEPTGGTPWAVNGLDCDDDHREVNPETFWYADGDGDGWLVAAPEAVQQCANPDGGDASARPQYWLPANASGSADLDALGDGDCDDADPGLNPETEWTPDEDRDGHGDLYPTREEVVVQCRAPLGFVRLDLADDCDDADELTNPETRWYRDADLDGYGLREDSVQACAPPEGYTARLDGDCEDGNEYFTRLCPYTVINAGLEHACGVQSNGHGSCWGYSSANELDVPVGVSFTDIRILYNIACGVTTGGGLRCWGDSWIANGLTSLTGIQAVSVDHYAVCALRSGELACATYVSTEATPTGGDFFDVAVLTDGGCALRGSGGEGAVECWGASSGWRQAAPQRSDLTQISLSRGSAFGANNVAACALTSEGTLACWGSDPFWDLLPAPTDSDFIQVSMGVTHACALHEDGHLSCWGTDRAGELSPPEGIVFQHVSAGDRMTCGVDVHGRPFCWGRAAPELATGFEHFGIGPEHGCAVNGATLGCWGASEPEPAFGDFVDVHVDRAGCAFTADRGMVCKGAIFLYSIAEVDYPRVDEDGLPLRFVDVNFDQDVETGEGGDCGLTVEGEVVCFGGTPPATLPSGDGWVAFSSNRQSAGSVLCAVHESGALECHGPLSTTTPGDGDFVDVLVLQQVICGLHEDGRISCFNEAESHPTIANAPAGGGFVKIVGQSAEYWAILADAPDDIACALHEDGWIRCWGDGAVLPPSGQDFVDITHGATTVCALDSAGAVSCTGALAADFNAFYATESFTAIAAGDIIACGVTEDGRALCGGAAELNGELVDIRDLSVVAPGARHTCLLVGGAVYCEGDGPVATQPPSILTAHTQLSSGAYHACALTEGGVVDCWGDDFFGQAQDPEGSDYVTIAAGGDSSCAIDAAGAVDCWGAVSWTDPGPFTAVAVGLEHACALTESGEVTCVGDDSQGQASPPEGQRFTAIALGDWHGCGLLEDGQPLCWGLDVDRQVRGAPSAVFTELHASGDQTCGIGVDGLPLCWGRAFQGDCPDAPLPTELGTCGE